MTSSRASGDAATVHEPRTRARHSPRRATIGSSFNPESNSLNLLRLVLALMVIFSHSLTIADFGSEDIAGKTTLGTVAVYGFFGLSGYLITRSATHSSLLRYLIARALRIFPAFWTCLVVVAFVFGPIVWHRANPAVAQRCSWSCYLREPGGPVGSVGRNLALQIHQSTIANTLPLGFFRPVWNGSLWTLIFEFACYVMIGLLAVLGALRHRWTVVALFGVVWTAAILITAIPQWNHAFSPSKNWFVMQMLTFIPLFLGGATIWLFREVIPDSGLLAFGSLGLFGLGFFLPLGGSTPLFTLTSTALTAVFLTYPLVWLGIHLPFPQVAARNDYSYGVYIYAYPVQQLLVVFGAASFGYLAYSLLSVVCVAPLAVASWWLIERPSLALKRRITSTSARGVVQPAPSAGQ